MESLNFDFLRSATEVGYGPVFRNDRYNLAVVQIEGTFTGLSMILEGRTDVDTGPWEAVAGWSVSDPNTKIETVSSAGIYEWRIEGIREFRFRILAISGGAVNASGVLYNSAYNSVYPYASASGSITFGDPALFVKGVCEQIFFDPSTGNIVGYDNTATDGSVTISVNLSEIAGGMGNRLIGVLPDTARISGAYTSSAFSLETRERIMGGHIAYNAVSQVCETVTADSETLAVSREPAPSLAQDPGDGTYWAYVKRVGGGGQKGTDVGIDPRTREIVNYAADTGEKYEITYFSHNVSAQMLPVPSFWNPVMMTVQERYGVYAKQNGSAEKGALKGWLYFIVPRAILNADAGANASETANATTDGSWIAIPEKPENMPFCDCDESAHPLAYYVYVPCAGVNDAIIDVVSVGSGLTLKSGRTAQLPIKLVMPDDSLVQPDFTQMGYYSENDAVAVVDNRGIVAAVSEGQTVIHAFVSKSDGSSLDSRTIVAVEGTRMVLTANRNNILVG